MWFCAHPVLPVRVEGAVRHLDQLPAHGLHPVPQLDLHLLLQEVNTSTELMVSPHVLCWSNGLFVFRRRQTRVRRKTKYTMLDNMDLQERVELRPKFSESVT